MTLQELTEVEDTKRDQSWENQFFQALVNSKLNLISAEPQLGPDNWPYLFAETAELTQQDPGAINGESAQKILRWLSERGIGLAINPRKEYPDYIFTYGMLWSFRESGYFHKPVPESAYGKVELDPKLLKHSGIPTEQYLPGYARKILREFFREQSILRPKILLLSQDQVHYDLAFSLESLGNPPDTEHEGIGEAISWFLPPHYSILLISEKGLPPFVDL